MTPPLDHSSHDTAILLPLSMVKSVMHPPFCYRHPPLAFFVAVISHLPPLCQRRRPLPHLPMLFGRPPPSPLASSHDAVSAVLPPIFFAADNDIPISSSPLPPTIS